MKPPSVTQLVDFAKCEKLAILKLSKAETINSARQSAIDSGVRAHARLEGQTVVDGRCFVASFAYGPSHPITESLRRQRDSILLPTRGGRGLVRAYYLISPGAVAVFRRLPGGVSAARCLVRFGARALGCLGDSGRPSS